jgi:glycosyltransferase involved in cell wall biosynthesis
LHLIWHPHNVGYGGNQKTCYLEALQRGADVVVMLHPDGQYEPELIPALCEPIISGTADLVLGSRFASPGTARAHGMPTWKYLVNRSLTIIENAMMGTELTEAHTGYRAYSREFLLTVPFLRNADDFSFDSEILMQAAAFHMRTVEVAARGRYLADSSSVGLRAGIPYGLKTLWAGVRLVLDRHHVIASRKYRA